MKTFKTVAKTGKGDLQVIIKLNRVETNQTFDGRTGKVWEQEVVVDGVKIDVHLDAYDNPSEMDGARKLFEKFGVQLRDNENPKIKVNWSEARNYMRTVEKSESDKWVKKQSELDEFERVYSVN